MKVGNIGAASGLSVSSTGSGSAGNLEAQAGSIRLDNGATLSSDTTGGQGNINLLTRNLILRRGNSITTNAIGKATGGNITINTDNLVAVPNEDSDISANAEESYGGRVIVNTNGIFGTQFRQQSTPSSDITASSAQGSEFNGTVTLNTPVIDPSQGLATLLTNFIDPFGLIANSCIGRSNQREGKFIITGNGGLQGFSSRAHQHRILYLPARCQQPRWAAVCPLHRDHRLVLASGGNERGLPNASTTA